MNPQFEPHMSATPSLDAAMGGDIAALNATVAQVYGTIHSTVFPKKIAINKYDIADASIDVLVAPTLSLDTSIEVTCTAISVVFESSTGGAPLTVNASATCDAAVVISAAASGKGWSLSVTLSNANFTVSNEPIFTALLNAIAGPLLLNYLNTSILSAINIPSLSLEGVDFQAPIIAQEQAGGDDFLVVYSGLSPVVVPAGGTEWPTGTLFVAVDANAIDAVVAKVLPKPSGSWSGGPFRADYSAQLGASIRLSPGAGSTLATGITVNATGDFTYSPPAGSPITFAAAISGSGTAAAAIAAVVGGSAGLSQVIQITVQSAGSFHFTITGIPDAVKAILAPFLDALLNTIGSVVSAVLKNFAFPVYTLDPIKMSFVGLSSYNIVPQNVVLTQIAGPGALAMAAVTLSVSVQPAS
jgi:hypothetical protein